MWVKEIFGNTKSIECIAVGVAICGVEGVGQVVDIETDTDVFECASLQTVAQPCIADKLCIETTVVVGGIV